MRGSRELACSGAAWLTLLAGLCGDAGAGAFFFVNDDGEETWITHPVGYGGAGGALSVALCIDPTSVHAADMELPVENAIRTINALAPSVSNLVSGAANNVPPGEYDFESSLLHELGHCIGLAHPNLGTESELAAPYYEFARATDGLDDDYDVGDPGMGDTGGSGLDGVRASADDLRDDDVNLHWFRKLDNDPFAIASVVDTGTYSRSSADLPSTHRFSAIASRAVSLLLRGIADTEAVMHQGTLSDEAQRSLAHDDVATLRLAMAGLDETAGTPDDYSLVLSYAGLTTSCDIPIDFDNAEVSFAGCRAGGVFANATHVVQTGPQVFFNDGFNWFFNDLSNAPKPVPSLSVWAGLCIGAACLGGAWLRLRGALPLRLGSLPGIPRSG